MKIRPNDIIISKALDDNDIFFQLFTNLFIEYICKFNVIYNGHEQIEFVYDHWVSGV